MSHGVAPNITPMKPTFYQTIDNRSAIRPNHSFDASFNHSIAQDAIELELKTQVFNAKQELDMYAKNSSL
jgi:hypothetical protein